ncbi:hypothetical protein RhiirC2_857418 [Rhizophagus irregularis]|uniref:Uncharacterized protein n=1 Tax=Rhizophagus irregularis TaxID=588596 RepID=A0A2N1MCD2_9GLOM|nr:hypothetical protein RhiirC2_857418 [Rhizophagus irregularis]
MENYQQKINDLLRKARAQGVARAAGPKKSFITNIVVTPKGEEPKSLKDIWRNTDSKNPTTIKSRKKGKSTKDKKSKTKKPSSGNRNHQEEFQRTNVENIPVPFVGFRRNKTSFRLEKYKEDTPPRFNKKYTLPTDSPGSDQSSDTSPLKNVKKHDITNYFQRMEIKTEYTDHSDTISPNFISPDITRSDTISREMVSSAFSENSSFISDENGDVLMTSAVSSPDRQVMMLSDDEEMGVKEGELPVFKVTKNTTTTHIHLPFSPKVTLDQTSEQKPDHRITPPNRNASMVGYFQKGKRKQIFTEFVTGDKLNGTSPDTLRILAAAQSNEELDRKFEMKNPFI